MTRALLTLPLLAIALQAQTGKLMHATGPMDVTVAPVINPATPETPAPYPRYSLRKHYGGPLEADALGEMLSGGDPRAGTAGYVAMETVTGTLQTPTGAHTGTFQLMQMGTMEAGKLTPEGKPLPPELRALIVPGSATGALKGLAGTMKIDNNAGKHTYILDYTLPTP